MEVAPDVINLTQKPQTKVNPTARFPLREALRFHEQKSPFNTAELKQWLTEVCKKKENELKEVRCSFNEFSRPIRFCSNLAETFFNPFPIRIYKKIGGHHVGFQDGADQSSLNYTRIFAQVFSINSAGWKAMNLGVCSNIWANTTIVPEMILRAFFALIIILQVKIANTIFGCLGHSGHTWANLGQMYPYDFC